MTPTNRSSAPPVVALRGIQKRFGGVNALRGADLTISRLGTVHGLLGANGSGKSTLLGVLSGQTRPDSGVVTIGGERHEFLSPRHALTKGIVMVAQETALAAHLSIAENIFLGHRMARRSFPAIDWSGTNRRAVEVLARLGLDYDPSLTVSHLRPDQQQMVEIARALSLEARILVLDEPTSSLTDDEVEALFVVVRQLRSQGLCVLFVSHRLTEVFGLCDELTVLRDGLTVGHGPIDSVDAAGVVELMVGEPRIRSQHQASRAEAGKDRGPALEVQGLSAAGVQNVDLEVASGEILGVTGLVGSGCSELLEAIYGVRPCVAGVRRLDGRQLPVSDPRRSIEVGLGYLPPDRKLQSLALKRTVRENLTVVMSLNRGRWRRPRGSAERARVEQLMQELDIRAPHPDVAVGTLSGGNQQKVAIGKWLAAEPRVLLLNEPTRGVDVAAKAEIHELIREAAGRGVAVLVSSSENDELIQLCDRVGVMFRGRLVATAASDGATESLLARQAGGHIDDDSSER